jgi:phosphoribosylformylglycinamidine synthase
LCESAIPPEIGFKLDMPSEVDHRYLFSESPSRALVSCDPSATDRLMTMASEMGVPARVIGTAGGSEMAFGPGSLDLGAARDAYEGSLAAHISGVN